jgi:hypothetical protein
VAEKEKCVLTEEKECVDVEEERWVVTEEEDIRWLKGRKSVLGLRSGSVWQLRRSRRSKLWLKRRSCGDLGGGVCCG